MTNYVTFLCKYPCARYILIDLSPTWLIRLGSGEFHLQHHSHANYIVDAHAQLSTLSSSICSESRIYVEHFLYPPQHVSYPMRRIPKRKWMSLDWKQNRQKGEMGLVVYVVWCRCDRREEGGTLNSRPKIVPLCSNPKSHSVSSAHNPFNMCLS